MTAFSLNDSHIATSSFNLPLQQIAGTRDRFSFNMHVDAPKVALPAKADADTWHRRIGHINGKRLDISNKTGNNSLSFKGGVTPCDVCAIRIFSQQTHSKTVTLNIEQPFDVVYTHLLGLIAPTALLGFRYVSNFIDEKSNRN